LGSQQLSIHIKTLLDDLKSSKDYCPRNLFSGSNSSPPKNLSRKIARFFVSKISPATGVSHDDSIIIMIFFLFRCGPESGLSPDTETMKPNILREPGT